MYINKSRHHYLGN